MLKGKYGQRLSSTYRVACQIFRSKRVGWTLEQASGISAAIGTLVFHKIMELYLHSHMRLHGVLLSHADKFTVSLYLHEPHTANTLEAKL
jgi:hypothetical protein